MTHNFYALKGVIARVLLKAVTVPARPYYVNYDIKTVLRRDCGTRTETVIYKYHVGPYPKIIARFLLEHWVSLQVLSNEVYPEQLVAKTLCLKPKKGSIEGPAPTKAEIEHLLMSTLVEPLEVYRELLALPEVTQYEVR